MLALHSGMHTGPRDRPESIPAKAPHARPHAHTAGADAVVRVLVVEDEHLMADTIALGLRRESFAVDVCYEGAEGLDKALTSDYDVVVLDRDLPGMHGDDVCRAIAIARPITRVLMLTASDAVAARVDGLSLGADDYLTKPFAFAELLARVRALGRRARAAAPPVLQRAGITLDPARRAASRDGIPLDLTRKEFGVLEELMRADGAVVTTNQLLERVWDENIDPFTNVLRVTVMTLRRKLGDPPLLTTVAGIGYQL